MKPARKNIEEMRKLLKKTYDEMAGNLKPIVDTYA